jgi:hypothetical protein
VAVFGYPSYSLSLSSLPTHLSPSVFVVALFTVALMWNQPRCSRVADWIKKMYTYTMEYYSAIKGKVILSFAKQMELKDFAKSDTERQTPYVVSLS